MKIAKFVDSLVTGALVAIAGAIAVLAVRNQFSEAAPVPREVDLRSWQRLLANGSVIGTRDAQMKIVEFVDYECSYCRGMHEQIDSLIGARNGQVALVVYQFPLRTLHAGAYQAALAAVCAREQHRFAAMHDYLFATQSERAGGHLENLPNAAGVHDSAAFLRCVDSDRASRAVEMEVAVGADLRVTGTPTFVIDRRIYAGAVPLKTLMNAFEAAHRAE